ncbi:MAG: DUF2721 domain-containing protein [Pseudomonadota bacterium]
MDSIAQIIQISVAPVFLLVAIGSFLNVVTGRLGRVVDRARVREAESVNSAEGVTPECRNELRVLDKRIRYCHWSINALGFAAFIVAVLVSVMFLTDLAGGGAGPSLIAPLFILAMTAIIAGLGFFLAEISVATRTVRVRRDLLSD